MLAGAPPIVFVATRDPARARAFYKGALGLPLAGEDAFALVFDAGGVMLRVVTVPDVVVAPYTVLGWRVPDVTQTVAALVRAGVAAERFAGLAQDAAGVWAAPSGTRIVWFKDPDGHLLSVTQFEDPTPPPTAQSGDR